ncbi:UDP-N-acetyl-D-mannosamine dehydrogenase [Thalassospiraceae bacterium LMO-JJ14]|nr:UDP-N-acetyl-D-mannosamine dehydrogenase [Thalassospiraceae bacterium LMO-JJ14]
MAVEHVCVIGLGYVGLPTAAVLASRGIRVTGVDVNPKTVGSINAGKPHIIEPDLDMVVHGAVSKGQLTARTEPVEADAFIIAVPTPFADGHKPDLSYLQSATEAIAPGLKKDDLVVVESTVPVGATLQVRNWLAGLRSDLSFPDPDRPDDAHDVCIAHSPERVLPGRVLLELVRNDRVIGGLGHDCAACTKALYSIAVEGEMHLTTAATAELVKLSENAYRDVNIAFANELANVAGPLGINVREVVKLANYHPRVNILNPGPGVGGHCIAVDPWFIASTAPDRTPLIQTARRVNDARPAAIAEQISALASVQGGATIACFGLSYKADIDDLRESPSIHVVEELRKRLANPILVIEPHIEALPESLAGLPAVSISSIEAALKTAACLVLLTDHRAFSAVRDEDLSGKDVIDTRGFWVS